MSSKPSFELPPATQITDDVERAFAEDLGSGDATAELLPADAHAEAQLTCREAAVIAGTWRQEPMIPSDDVRQNALPGLSGPVGSPALGEMLSRVELDIRRLEPQNPLQRRLAATCIAQFERLMQVRWRLAEDSGSSISTQIGRAHV